MDNLGHLFRKLGAVLMIGSAALAEIPEAPKVPFSFKKKPLTQLLEKMAPPGTNILFPQRAADLEALKQQQITYLPQEKETSQDTGWHILKTFLELSGFSIFKQHQDQFTVVRNSSVDGGAINREPLPVYAGVLPDHLPHDDGRIIYIHYLKNLRVPEVSEKDSHPLTAMLKQLLTYNASLLFDPKSNAIIIIDKASHAISVAHLLNEFDNRGIKEQVAYVPLTYLPAQELVSIFDTLKLAAGDGQAHERSFIRSDPEADAIGLFTQDTRMVADTMRNGVILMGREANVERIAEFIQDSLDVPQDAKGGGSILHYYDLNYLDSIKTAPILNRIVTAALPAGEQATAEGDTKPLFRGAVIAAIESVIRKPALKTEDIAIEQKGFPEVENLDAVATNAGNRLVIAARESDWQIIKKLLQQIDTQQPQVLLEMVVVEFSYDHTTSMAGTIRSKTDSPNLPHGVQYLASHITPVVSVLGTTPTQLAVDLLQIIGPGNVPSQVSSGSLLLSINDPKTPGIFGLLEILDTVVSAKITSYPYITIKNHTEGLLDTTEMKRTTGDVANTTNGTATIPIIDLPATFAVHAVPHIVSDTRLRLAIGFTEDYYVSSSSLTRNTSELRTTATLNSGEILVMGGLIRTDNLDSGTNTPILGNIPIVGSFFRGTSCETIKTNVVLFVMPTILEPRSRWTEKTKGAINENKNFVTWGQTPSNLRDPIYRLFFRDESDQRMINNFVAQGTNLDSAPGPSSGLKLMHTQNEKSQVPLFDSYKLKKVLALKSNPLGYGQKRLGSISR